MSRTYHFPNRRAGRCQPRLERLESRLALSLGGGQLPLVSFTPPSLTSLNNTLGTDPIGPYLSVVSTDPLPGSRFSQSPTTLGVTFDRPLDSATFAFEDIRIEREDGGTWSPAFDPFSAPWESLDETGTQLLLTPFESLTPGHYRLVLPTGSSLMGLDGSMIDDPGYDQVLGDFTITQPGVTLADAEVVPDVTLGPISIPGQLDLAGDPGAVALYRVDLPAGHRWQLGAEVASAIDGTLLSTLSLFDAQGQLIATVNHGRPGAPNDAFLFAGLEPGTYYLGVSGRGNVPGQPGGYDPATGLRGSSNQTDGGGAFHLNLVADPADSPAELQWFRLDQADPVSSSPTGITLGFSAALNLETLRGNPVPGIVVIGPDGQVVPLASVASQPGNAQYSFIFGHALSPGTYTVRVAEQGGVTDLSGLTPTAPGEPAGVLAHFTIATAPSVARNPNDLGPLYPGLTQELQLSTSIEPGTAVTYRFVVLGEGLYQFPVTAEDPGAQVELRFFGPDGLTSFGNATEATTALYLKPGVYQVQLVNLGTAPIHVSWRIDNNTPWDSLLDNGVGQGSALNLRLVNPSAPAPGPGPATGQGPAWTPPTAGPISGGDGGASGGATLLSSTTAPVFAPVASLPASSSSALALAPGNAPVGRPTGMNGSGAVVGSTPGGAVVSLVSMGSPVPQSNSPGQGGLLGRQLDPISSTDPDDEVEADPGESVAESDAAPINGAMPAEPAAAQPTTPDDRVIAAADWIAQLGRGALDLMSNPVSIDPPPEPGTAAPELARMPDDELTNAGRVERAQFDAPLIVGAASVIAMRYHQPVVHWLRQKSGLAAARRRRSGVPSRGPHRRP